MVWGEGGQAEQSRQTLTQAWQGASATGPDAQNTPLGMSADPGWPSGVPHPDPLLTSEATSGRVLNPAVSQPPIQPEQ